jgi:hypothetical protein
MALRVLILLLLAPDRHRRGSREAQHPSRPRRSPGRFRLALALTGLGMSSWILGAHHGADLLMEISLLARGAGLVVLLAALLWLFYLALEPYVRRLRPWTLISWTRLLGGGLRDAVVGRDVLIGMTWGAAVAVVFLVSRWVPVWLGLAAPLPLAASPKPCSVLARGWPSSSA